MCALIRLSFASPGVWPPKSRLWIVDHIVMAVCASFISKIAVPYVAGLGPPFELVGFTTAGSSPALVNLARSLIAEWTVSVLSNTASTIADDRHVRSIGQSPVERV